MRHQGADGSRRRVYYINLEFIHDIPEPACIRESRDALEHQAGGAGSKRTIYNIAVARHPADIRGTEIYLTGLIIKYIHKSISIINHIPRAGMHHPFGLAGAAAGI